MTADSRSYKTALYRAIALCVAIILCSVGWSFVHVWNSEDMHFGRNSAWYYLLIDSPLIKQVPTGNCEVTYYSTVGDGNKLPAQGIELKCAGFPDRAISKITEFLHGYKACSSALLQLEEMKQRSLSKRYDYECESASDGNVSLTVWRYEDMWHLTLTVQNSLS